MRRLVILSALIVAGCTNNAATFSPQPVSPRVFQKQPLNNPWLTTRLLQASLPTDLAAGSKGYIWVADSGRQLISRVSPRLGYKDFPLSIKPYAITIGSDDNVWVTVKRGGIVARITPTGVETDFNIGLPTAEITQIIAGPDGALWFSVLDPDNSDGVGRITTSGAFKFYPAASGAFVLTSGTDGNIWFTDYSNLYVMTVQGQIVAQYPLSDQLYGSVIGPDGNMWFTGNNNLYRVTSGGQVSQYASPPGSGLFDIANEDGRLWITGNSQNGYAVLPFDPISLTFGTPIPSPNIVRREVTGPDGNLWMTGLNAAITTYVVHILSVTPTSLTLQLGQKAETSGTLAVNETNYSGTWSAQWPSSLVNVVQNSPGVFTVTAVGRGTGKVTIQDTMHNYAKIPITVQ
jgi:virginiamycin B lyase